MSVDQVLQVLTAPLEDLGFRKRKAGIFTIPLSDGFLGWLGLNTSSRYSSSDVTNVHPVVGVQVIAVDKILRELGAWPKGTTVTPTVSRPLGSLMSPAQRGTWTISSATNIGGRSQSLQNEIELLSCVSSIGMGFMRNYQSLKQVEEGLKSGFGELASYKLPVVIFLTGELDRARDLVTRATQAADDGPAGRHYLAFAKQLSKMINMGDTTPL